MTFKQIVIFFHPQQSGIFIPRTRKSEVVRLTGLTMFFCCNAFILKVEIKLNLKLYTFAFNFSFHSTIIHQYNYFDLQQGAGESTDVIGSKI